MSNSKMHQRRVALVTGSGGFLGLRVVPKLLSAGWRVRCVVRSLEAARRIRSSISPEHADFVEIKTVEMADAVTCELLLRNCETLVHLAAAGSGSAAALFADTVSTTRRLVQAAGVSGTRVLLVSSFSVYRTDHLRAGGVLDETCPLEPRPECRDAYAFSKLAQERVCVEAAARWNFPLAILRPSVIYGPGRGLTSSRVGLQIGSRLLRFGSSHQLPYVYVDNCADGIAAAAGGDAAFGEAINMVDDELPTPRRITDALARVEGGPKIIPLSLASVKLGVSAYDRLARWSDGMLPLALTPYKASAQWKPLRYPNDKAKALLGWYPRVSLADGIAATVAWQRGGQGAA